MNGFNMKKKISSTKQKITIERAWAMPNRWTFTIKPINELLKRYVKNGKQWVDPYAGKYSPAQFTNDINPEMPTKQHKDATKFLMELKGKYNGVLYDPPYSYRQVSEHYKAQGIKATALDTSTNFYNRSKNAICDKIKKEGYAICCGWNSVGFGKNRGFELIEVLIVCHGGHHNDTIVTVERKL